MHGLIVWSAAILARLAAIACAAGALVVAPALGRPPAAASGFPPGIQPRYREVGDWLVACDNTRQCVAKYVLGEYDGDADPYDEDAGLTISREAGPSGTILVDVTSCWQVDPGTIHIDGAPAHRQIQWEAYDDGKGAQIDGAAAMAFVRSMRNAKTVSWSGKQHSSIISLVGLAPVLIAMDDAQGRIGNASAIGRPGPRPASDTPAAVAPPVVRRGHKLRPLVNSTNLIVTLRQTQVAALALHDCDQESGTDDSADPLDGHTAIMLLGCGRFAYQTSVLAFVVPLNRPGSAKPLVLATPMSSTPLDPETVGEYVGGSFDADTQVFSTYGKGRGIADCGESAEWTWDGAAFHLSAFASQQRCGGASGDWPTLFRSRTAIQR